MKPDKVHTTKTLILQKLIL